MTRTYNDIWLQQNKLQIAIECQIVVHLVEQPFSNFTVFRAYENKHSPYEIVRLCRAKQLYVEYHYVNHPVAD